MLDSDQIRRYANDTGALLIEGVFSPAETADVLRGAADRVAKSEDRPERHAGSGRCLGRAYGPRGPCLRGDIRATVPTSAPWSSLQSS